MTFIFGAMIFWCGAFVGFIAASLFSAIPRDEPQETHTDYRGEP
jgi:hypothetical protein